MPFCVLHKDVTLKAKYLAIASGVTEYQLCLSNYIPSSNFRKSVFFVPSICWGLHRFHLKILQISFRRRSDALSNSKSSSFFFLSIGIGEGGFDSSSVPVVVSLASLALYSGSNCSDLPDSASFSSTTAEGPVSTLSFWSFDSSQWTFVFWSAPSLPCVWSSANSIREMLMIRLRFGHPAL